MFARDKLYNGYLRRNLPTIVSTVKVREIVVHLPCLTDHDRETIEAKREINGNHDAMMLLLDCLKRRENWPEQFIQALEECEHTTIAADIRAEYNSLRGINNLNPGAGVVNVQVHPAPSAPPAPVALPAEASAPPQPAAQASPPLENAVQPQAAQSSAAQVPKAVSPPEPPQSAQIDVAPPPSTLPLSPETLHTPARTPPPVPKRELFAHQEPEENSESDIQDVSGDTGVSPNQVSAGSSQVSISSVSINPLSRPESLQTATTSAEDRPPQSSSQTQANSHLTSGSSKFTVTPKKPPVQDTRPPMEKVHVLEPDETSEPPATQVVENSRQRETAAAASPLPAAAVVGASHFDMYLSKPGQLVSVPPQDHTVYSTSELCALPAHGSLVEPYSGSSERLEISEAALNTVTSVQVPAVFTVSGLPCQENGVALDYYEPEENQYESPCHSFGIQDVRMNVGQVSEEPSILNLDGQPTAPQDQIVNAEAAKEFCCASPSSATTADTVSSLNTHSSENYHPSEPAPAEVSPEPLPDSEGSIASRMLRTNQKYILITAGVSALVLLSVWRFRK
uniref:Mitochondrial antiviral-signaling protein n=2 Tax=Monopterus albus TaxID=43700 RepID=A0A3Q3IGG5_MONAL|nr:mitochondrial antiviral-signaling protein isoform X2 [Monopterus albus]XP_020459890.1 mitochondrial antiviral-signaling protein isoform X2 [Monopterus albus]